MVWFISKSQSALKCIMLANCTVLCLLDGRWNDSWVWDSFSTTICEWSCDCCSCVSSRRITLVRCDHRSHQKEACRHPMSEAGCFISSVGQCRHWYYMFAVEWCVRSSSVNAARFWVQFTVKSAWVCQKWPAVLWGSSTRSIWANFYGSCTWHCEQINDYGAVIIRRR